MITTFESGEQSLAFTFIILTGKSGNLELLLFEILVNSNSISDTKDSENRVYL